MLASIRWVNTNTLPKLHFFGELEVTPAMRARESYQSHKKAARRRTFALCCKEYSHLLQYQFHFCHKIHLFAWSVVYAPNWCVWPTFEHAKRIYPRSSFCLFQLRYVQCKFSQPSGSEWNNYFESLAATIVTASVKTKITPNCTRGIRWSKMNEHKLTIARTARFSLCAQEIARKWVWKMCFERKKTCYAKRRIDKESWA